MLQTTIPPINDKMYRAAEKVLRNIRNPKPPPPAPIARDAIQEARFRYARMLLERQYEGLRLYEPLPLASEFHRCNAMWRLADGSNRAGKTLACAIEDAYALTGQHPHKAYPQYNGFALFVGLERKHLSLMYRYLFLPGAFKIIQDEHTKLWRAVRYDRNNPTQLQEYDLAFRERWKDAPPLIPPRMVAHISFELPEVPRAIRMNNGWRSLWQSAAGKPPQGEHINHAHFDEEMPDPEYYKETHRGLTRLHETVRQRPKAIWSATSQVANVELAELRDKAETDPESDFVRRFVFLIENNPYFTPDARKEFYDGLSDDDRQTRYHGIPATQVRRIYTEYNIHGESSNGSGHGCDPFEIDPKMFARYVILDPAINHCTTLFCAVDPDEQYLTVYDGFEATGDTARDWAAEVCKRQNGYKFEALVIDQQMGKNTPIIREKTTVAREFMAAFKEAGGQVRRLGPLEGFIPGSNDVDARTHALRSIMEVRGTGAFEGTCKLRVFRNVPDELNKQIRRAQTDPKNPMKRLKNPKVPQDFLDDLEYAAAGQLCYSDPVPINPEENRKPSVLDVFKERRRIQRQHDKARARHAAALR